MSNQITSAFDAQIAQLEADINATESQIRQASLKLAGSPQDADALAQLRSLNQSLTILRSDLVMLEGARNTALEASQTEKVKRHHQEAGDTMRQIEALAGKRIKVGAAIDSTIAKLHEAIQEWVQLGGQVADAACKYHHVAGLAGGSGSRNHPDLTFYLRPDILKAGNVAIACQLMDALQPLEMHDIIAFNVYRDMRVPGSVQKDATIQSERMVQGAKHFARTRGVPA